MNFCNSCNRMVFNLPFNGLCIRCYSHGGMDVVRTPIYLSNNKIISGWHDRTNPEITMTKLSDGDAKK